ncbi:MAG TPA: RsmD family RNA methyltransferase [Terriglobales bacterium]|nr:RsmD family RNA methyltransferase [Terriglobales bacterium]
MRVIGGALGSRRLRAPRGQAVRPSADRLRQALFNILGPEVRGRLFVDAFAGTGAVGIEAWSRGARPVVWIEPAPAAARALRANLAQLGIAGGAVLERPLPAGLAALERLPALRAAAGCDYFFFDPPYADAAAYPATLAALDRRPGLLRPGARIIAETRRGLELPLRCGRLRRARVHPQGDSQLVFYDAEPEPPAAPPPACGAA